MPDYLYNCFANRFADYSLSALLESYNNTVGHTAIHLSLKAHHEALLAEFMKRGIDVSEVYDGTSIIFIHKVRLDGNRLVKE